MSCVSTGVRTGTFDDVCVLTSSDCARLVEVAWSKLVGGGWALEKHDEKTEMILWQISPSDLRPVDLPCRWGYTGPSKLAIRELRKRLFDRGLSDKVRISVKQRGKHSEDSTFAIAIKKASSFTAEDIDDALSVAIESSHASGVDH